MSTICFYEKSGFFTEGVAKEPSAESTPEPDTDKDVVFYEFFVVGLHFPCDPMLPEILDHYSVKLHQLTPNLMV